MLLLQIIFISSSDIAGHGIDRGCDGPKSSELLPIEPTNGFQLSALMIVSQYQPNTLGLSNSNVCKGSPNCDSTTTGFENVASFV